MAVMDAKGLEGRNWRASRVAEPWLGQRSAFKLAGPQKILPMVRHFVWLLAARASCGLAGTGRASHGRAGTGRRQGDETGGTYAGTWLCRGSERRQWVLGALAGAWEQRARRWDEE